MSGRLWNGEVKDLSFFLFLFCFVFLSFSFLLNQSPTGWFTVAIVIWMMVWMIWEVFDAVLVLFFVQTLVLLVYYTWDEGYCYCGDCVSNPDLYR